MCYIPSQARPMSQIRTCSLYGIKRKEEIEGWKQKKEKNCSWKCSLAVGNLAPSSEQHSTYTYTYISVYVHNVGTYTEEKESLDTLQPSSRIWPAMCTSCYYSIKVSCYTQKKKKACGFETRYMIIYRYISFYIIYTYLVLHIWVYTTYYNISIYLMYMQYVQTLWLRDHLL